jgi:hypothetical protein
MEIIDVIQRGTILAAVISDHPFNYILGYDGVDVPRKSIIIRVPPNKYYYINHKAYAETFRRLQDKDDSLLNLLHPYNLFIEAPLELGKRMCTPEEAATLFANYCWRVESSRLTPRRDKRSIEQVNADIEYVIGTYGDPHTTRIGITPKVGITSYYYKHPHAEVDLTLVAYRSPDVSPPPSPSPTRVVTPIPPTRTPTRPPTATPTVPRTPPPLPTVAPVFAPYFVVNEMPVGCHKEPDAGAEIAVQRPVGTVQVMDAFIAKSDGFWYREVYHQCWTRTSPGPVRTFGIIQEAEQYAASIAITLSSWVTIIGLREGECFNLRTQPSTTDTNSRVVRCYNNGTRMQVLEGPRLVDGKRWWRVSLGGWMADDNFVRE